MNKLAKCYFLSKSATCSTFKQQGIHLEFFIVFRKYILQVVKPLWLTCEIHQPAKVRTMDYTHDLIWTIQR